MQRRTYLTVVGVALLGGCAGDSGQSSPTGTSESTPTPTSTPEPTETQTETATETETPTKTETETPSKSERAAALISDVRDHLGRAHETYLSQGNYAETLVDVGPETTGFDASPIQQECDTALELVGQASDLANDDQRGTVLHLRSSTNWLSYIAELQEVISTFVEYIEEAEIATSEQYNFDAAQDAFTDAYEEVSEIEDVRTKRTGVSLPAFRDIDEIDADAIKEKDTQLNRQASALMLRLGSQVQNAADAAERLEGAQLDLEASQYDSAEREATTAKQDLDYAIADFDEEGDSIEGFDPVADMLEDAAGGLKDDAERIIAVAQRSRNDSGT